MPNLEAPCVELGSAPRTPSVVMSPSPSEVSSASSLEIQNVQASPLFRVLALPPPDPEQPPGQDELERRLPGYRRIVIPRELTLIELLKQCSGVTTDDEVLRIREAKLRVVAERVGLRRLHVLAPHLKTLILDGSAMSSLRDLGIGLTKLKILSLSRAAPLMKENIVRKPATKSHWSSVVDPSFTSKRGGLRKEALAQQWDLYRMLLLAAAAAHSLSVNRCGLNSLDGVWGLGALRELYAAGNRLHDLHALAALQKLHTLNLANNPIEESSRIWTLGVCSSLRRLTLSGTPLSDIINYRSHVASALPMLVTLDDIPLNTNEDDWDYEIPSDTESVESVSESNNQLLAINTKNQDDPRPGTSKLECQENDRISDKRSSEECAKLTRRRPATTECAGPRPRHAAPLRPATALQRSVNGPARLHIMNTLMDDEWRCCGSKMTSHGAVSGNLARALRRPKQKSKLQNSMEAELEMVEKTMEEACRSLAAEIPCAPNSADWAKFRQETGIEIDIDFNERPKDTDPSEVIERLERIERETVERLNKDSEDIGQKATNTFTSDPSRIFSGGITGDDELWKEMQDLTTCDPPNSFDDLFKNIIPNHPRTRESDNDSLG